MEKRVNKLMSWRGVERRKNIKLHSEESLSIIRWRFWDLLIQKIFRNIVSMKFILFISILWISSQALYVDKISGVTFGLITTGALVVIAVSKVVTDTKLIYRNGDKRNE